MSFEFLVVSFEVEKMPNFNLKLVAGIITNLVIYGGLLFGPAGTFLWWRAWVFLGVVLIATVATMFFLRERPDLLNERFKSPIRKGQPLADKIILILFIATYVGMMVFIPLDIFRFHLLAPPGAVVSTLGLVLFVAGWWIFSLALKENPFGIAAVKFQEERHQRVVDTGVYAVVRHPMYAGGILLIIGMPLWLESYAALLLAIIPSAVLGGLRIQVEERFLKEKLPGYAAYMEKVRYRLVPYIW
jgi:protein-S-isoprenylcysteine O-methyltransferase Ste14